MAHRRVLAGPPVHPAGSAEPNRNPGAPAVLGAYGPAPAAHGRGRAAAGARLTVDPALARAAARIPPLCRAARVPASRPGSAALDLSLIHISEPTRLGMISY